MPYPNKSSPCNYSSPGVPQGYPQPVLFPPHRFGCNQPADLHTKLDKSIHSHCPKRFALNVLNEDWGVAHNFIHVQFMAVKFNLDSRKTGDDPCKYFWHSSDDHYIALKLAKHFEFKTFIINLRPWVTLIHPHGTKAYWKLIFFVLSFWVRKHIKTSLIIISHNHMHIDLASSYKMTCGNDDNLWMSFTTQCRAVESEFFSFVHISDRHSQS